jgi:hypothetical protein
VNLRNLQNLQVFSLCAIIKSKALWNAQRFAVLHDINIVLGTIPESNKVTNLWFDFMIVDQHPFHECLDQNWVGMFNEIIRISDGKPLELEFQMVVSMGFSKIEHSGQAELFVDIMKKAASLSDHPKICTHFWNPTFGAHGPGPFPRGQVRSRCMG